MRRSTRKEGTGTSRIKKKRYSHYDHDKKEISNVRCEDGRRRKAKVTGYGELGDCCYLAHVTINGQVVNGRVKFVPRMDGNLDHVFTKGE